MNRKDNLSGESRRRHSFDLLVSSHPWLRRPKPNDDGDINAIAHSEGWLTPPAEVTRIALRPWQQAVFWGLRIYIVVMLIIMAFGFAHVAGS